MLALLVGVGVVGAFAVRFGYEHRPGLRSDDEWLVERGRPQVDVEEERRRALEGRRRSVGLTRTAVVKLDEAAFRSVGLSLTTDRSRAFAAALCLAATEEREHGDGGWPGRAVDRLVRGVEVEHLCRVVEDLGLGQARPAGDGLDDGASVAVHALLTHLLRDRLQDALRIAAGLRPFWIWDVPADAGEQGLAAPEQGAGDRTAEQVAA
jgi:hypothetical protein